MPPRVWVDACHARGVPCLGTLIIEADDGENDALLSDVEGAVVRRMRFQKPRCVMDQPTRSTRRALPRPFPPGLAHAPRPPAPTPRRDTTATPQESLCALCEHHGFDGWLVNLEAPLRHPSGAAGVARLRELLELLTICLKPRVGEQALCLLYDSLNEAGQVCPSPLASLLSPLSSLPSLLARFTSSPPHSDVPPHPQPKGGVTCLLSVVYPSPSPHPRQVRYQNALTPANASLFGACDGLFTNYWWGPPQLSLSVSLAGPSAPGTPDRRHDVYCGVDCFARNCSYAEGLGCAAPCRAARNAGLSLALFAPGWSLERGPGSRAPDDAAAARADREFWDALGLRRM